MQLVKVTVIQENRETRHVILNTGSVEMISDELLTKVDGDASMSKVLAEKDMRSLRCALNSGTIINIKFNGKAADLARMIRMRNLSYYSGITKHVPNWTWRPGHDLVDIRTDEDIIAAENACSMSYDNYDRW